MSEEQAKLAETLDAEPYEAAKRLRTWRPMALWSLGILLVLGLVWFVAVVAVPVWQVHRVIEQELTGSGFDGHALVERLGGPEKAFGPLCIYTRLPAKVATHRTWAAHLMGYCGPRAVPILTKLLEEEDHEMRWWAAVGLGKIGHPAVSVLPTLVGRMAEADGAYAEDLCGVIDDVGPPTPDMVPELVALLRDQDSAVRWCAASQLGRMGKHATAVVPTLTRLLEDEDETVRHVAAEALKKIRSEEAGK